MAVPVLVAVSGAAWESDLVLALERHRSLITVVRRCVDVPDLLAAAATGQARSALLAVELPRLDADVVARLVGSGVQPIGVVTPGSEDERQRLSRIGIAVHVDADRVDMVSSAAAGGQRLDGSASNRPRPAPSRGQSVRGAGRGSGRLVAVWGPTGAPGRSTVAVGLAGELAGLGKQTLLVDADVYGGSLAQQLGLLDESSGLLAAARSANAGALGAAELAGYARQIAPSLRVLTGLPRADRWPELRPAALTGALAAARDLAEYVVVDVGFNLEQEEELSFDTAAPRRNGATLLLLEQADLVLVVGSADPVGLARLLRGVVDLTEAVPGVAMRICVNRMRPSLGWSEAEVTESIAKFTGISTVDFLPADVDACDAASVHGRLFSEAAPESGFRLALLAVAGELAGPAGSARRQRRRWLIPTGARARRAQHVRSPG